LININNMHLRSITIHPGRFPRTDVYPFNVRVLRNSTSLEFSSNISFFIGDNGSGKSTLLKTVTRKSGIHIWAECDRRRYSYNEFEETLHQYIDIEWNNGSKPGAFFSSETYQHMSGLIDEWASMDRGLLQYFGGRSLVTQSHGESFMSFFKSRYTIEGLYFLDEPETALSPRRQISFLKFLQDMALDGHAQFIIATHSPILLACPAAEIFSFDGPHIAPIAYENTDYFRVYKEFLNHREAFLR